MNELIQLFEKITESNSTSNTNISKIIVVRLCTERIGEIDHNSWWQSRALSPFGTTKLKEIMPKTYVLAKIKIAFEIGHKKEQELINEKDYVSLFRLTPEIEKLIESILHTSPEKIKPFLDSNLDLIKFDETNLSKSECNKIDTKRELINSNIASFSLGELNESTLSQDKINQIIDEFIYAWSKNKKGQLLIPYYRVKK